ncbi:MAG: mandelate racemase/muconate lactonizing enzyme family protein [SAR202 cluster bacterium]|nr:mandelate racemase/muconate lactonizing enzyme family protein [SAR202 cluster bacterium]MDP6714316.1 mandelate racemase/muconate lactonizing enzyme family protein [SAR202 cluster bacterium]
MKITDIQVNQLKPPEGRTGGRLLVRVFTDEGIIGYSEGSRGLGVFRAYLDDVIKPLLVGTSPLQPRQIWETLALGTGEQATRLPSQIVGAIDVACWDIMGKAAGMPVYSLLGGARRTEIPLYWSRGNGWKKQPEEMLEEVQEGYEKGYRAFKVRMDWRDYRQDSNPVKDMAIYQKCREWLPDGVPLGFDANCGYSVSTAIEQGRQLEEMGAAHFEEPLPQYDFPGLRQVVDALDVAVSTGEQELSAWRFRDLMMLGNPDILQPDILNVGGLSEVVRVFEMAVTHNKVVMPHSPSLGLNSLASLHAYSTVTNAVRPHEFSEEFTGPVPHVAALFVDPIVPENGAIKLSDRPGLGVEIDEKALADAIIA